MLRGSYSLDGDGQPCCPYARQPSYSSPRQHLRPHSRICRCVPSHKWSNPCQSQCVRRRPDGSQKTSRMPKFNNPDPRPFIKFSGDPASGSPLSSLTLLLTRELERGTVGASMAYARLQQQWSPPECGLCLISTYHTPGIVPTALYLMLRRPTRLPGRLSGPGSAARWARSD